MWRCHPSRLLKDIVVFPQPKTVRSIHRPSHTSHGPTSYRKCLLRLVLGASWGRCHLGMMASMVDDATPSLLFCQEQLHLLQSASLAIQSRCCVLFSHSRRAKCQRLATYGSFAQRRGTGTAPGARYWQQDCTQTFQGGLPVSPVASAGARFIELGTQSFADVKPPKRGK